MLNNVTRNLVESVRRAETITIYVNEGMRGEVTITMKQDIKDIRRLRHEIALAVQDYFNNEK